MGVHDIGRYTVRIEVYDNERKRSLVDEAYNSSSLYSAIDSMEDAVRELEREDDRVEEGDLVSERIGPVHWCERCLHERVQVDLDKECQLCPTCEAEEGREAA